MEGKQQPWDIIEMSGKNSSPHIKAQYFTCVDVHLRLSCVSFKEVSQADET